MDSSSRVSRRSSTRDKMDIDSKKSNHKSSKSSKSKLSRDKSSKSDKKDRESRSHRIHRDRDRERDRDRRDRDRSSRDDSRRRSMKSNRDRDRERERERGDRDRDRERRHRRRSHSRSRSRGRRRNRRSKSRSNGKSKSRSTSSSRPLPAPKNRHRKNKFRTYWDCTPEMCQHMGIELNPWQPSPDNPYFSSAAAASAAAAAAAVTNPHNKDLHKNIINKNNMTVIAQRMSGTHGTGGIVNPYAAAGAVAIAATNPLLAAMNNPLLRKVEEQGLPMTSGNDQNPFATLFSKIKQASDHTQGVSKQEVNPLTATQTLADAVKQSNYLHQTRASRRIYVGNLPINSTEEQISQFFNATMVAAQGKNRVPGDSVVNVYLNTQKRFAFVEFRSADEATQAMDLEGIQFFGEPLKIGRPANYNPNLIPTELKSKLITKLNTTKLGIVSNFVTNGPNKLYCGGIPYSLTEDQVKELLTTYGPLKAFFLAKDPNTGLSKGYCFFQYKDPSVNDEAINGLNGIKIGDRQLSVRRHTPNQTNLDINTNNDENNSNSNNNSNNNSNEENSTSQHPLNQMIFDGSMNHILPESLQPQQNSQSKKLELDKEATSVLMLDNMITRDDLKSDEDYNEILEDVTEECKQYGNVLSVVIPRPDFDNSSNVIKGVGKIYVSFENKIDAHKAKSALQGRTFDDKIVKCIYFDVEKFINKDF